MKLKTLAIAVAVLAILSVVVFWMERPPAPVAADPRVGNDVVPSSLVDKAAQIRLTDSGKTVTLVRQADGSWKDASYYDLPVDFSKLSSFTSDLASAKIQRLVTSNPATIARLDFKDSKIELLDASGKVLWSVVLGKNADSGGRFLRYGDEPKAYLATLNAWLDSDGKNWADAALLNLKSDDIASVKVGFATGEPTAEAKGNGVLDKLDQLKKFGAEAANESVTVSRAKKDDPWTADKPRAGQRISADKVSSILSSLTTLRFSDTSDRNDPQAKAAKAHARTIVLTTFAGKSYTVTMGRKPEEKKLKPTPKTPPAKAAAKEAKAKTPAKPAEPEYDTIPAGPVFAWVTSSEAHDPINALMKKRAFQIDEYTFTSLPQKSDELFEPAPAKKK